MKTILALSAAVLLLSAGGALAAPKVTTISLDGFCDVLQIQKNKVLKTAMVLHETSTDCEGLYGNGFVSKISTFGHVALIGLRGGSIPDEEYVIELAYPFVTGGSFIIYGTSDGVNLTAFSGSTYTVGGTPARGSKPVLSAVRR
jgi:hypothetical protein